MFRITELHIDNIGPFKKAEFRFKEKPISEKAEIHILTGENGTGKSTILIALASILGNIEQIQKRYRIGKEPSTFKITLSENGNGSTVQVRNRMITSSPTIEQYTNLINGRRNDAFSFGLLAYSAYREIGTTKLESIKELSGSAMANSLNFHRSANPQQLIQWIANQITKHALFKVNNNEKKAIKYKDSVSKIEDAISEIIGSKIEFILQEEPLDVLIRMHGCLQSFDVLPDGLKSILSWVADLLMRMDRTKWEYDLSPFERNLVLFLDEIDVHLHPAWQRKILPVIQKLFINSQIFISTHSPFVVGSVDGAWVYKLKTVDGINQLDGEPILSENAKSFDLILNEIFGVKKRFGEAIEDQLNRFYQLRNEIVSGNKDSINDFISLFENLSNESSELDNILAMEIKQLERVTKEKIISK